MVSTAATTLITFMLRTPPNTHSLKLLGSWDNFSQEYTMERDTRTGPDHWRGCHVFTNIICDGNLSTTQAGRDGGLRMGGTYWYYYRLNGDVDYYNEAEPWTTSCPFLPGQPINILNVPIHLPSADSRHKRESSTVSQRSIPQTMNPDDKYLNPRPPPRPRLPRLLTSTGGNRSREALTSPIASSPQHPVHGRSASHPRDLPARRKFRVSAKLTLDAAPPTLHSTKGSALRTAFLNFKTPRSVGKDAENEKRFYSNGREDEMGYKVDDQRGRSPRSNTPSPSHFPLASGHSGQTLQVPVKIYGGKRRPASPFGSRSASRSASQTRDRSPLRTPMEFQQNHVAESPYRVQDDTESPVQDLDLSDPPSLMVPCKLDLGSTIDLNEKRLPTLPNSPSSVLDEELRRMGFKSPVLDIDALHSHFSASTAASANMSPNSFLQACDSRFSECSTDTDALSPSSMTSGSTFNNDGSLSSRRSFSTSEPIEVASIQTALPRLAGLRITDDSDLLLPHLHYFDTPSPPTTVPAESLSDIRISALHIAKKVQPSDIPVSESKVHLLNGRAPDSGLPTPRASGEQMMERMGGSSKQRPSAHMHNMMQEIMDELSYLGGMINVDSPVHD
ncbi:predicted protein [Uncinocarpus reesii 1704]|uniref:Uncharacterized protein n=1 Tax=Uncinocarpus reesii (strain UAMH 1704) TaxID=336963 RepID=C4JI96_UNCRE|nr:uncharacterized protein UREG_02842 [Uncinocarpus reesii 1704]EEP77993.1 predicted protein [Uncinocarpus reesii 1704]